MIIKVKVNTVDRTGIFLSNSIRIDSALTNRIDTCVLTFEDVTGAVSFTEWDEIIVSNVAETTRYFAGYITHIERGVRGITKTHKCECQDYTILPGKIVVNEVYLSKADAYILNDLFTKYLPEINASTYVATGKLHDRITFNRTTLREAVDILSRESGLDWYVDYNKYLHYFTKETYIAPFGLSDTPDLSTTYPYSSLKYERDFTSPINRVTVVGGYYLSDDADFELPGNAQTKEILMPYRMHKPSTGTAIRIYRNDNNDTTPSWTELTVGTDHIDELGGGIDVLHNFQEKLLKFGTAPPNLKRAIKVTGQYDVPVLVRVKSESSYAIYGRWFDGKIVNQDIDSLAWAKLEGQAVLVESAFIRESGNLKEIQDGLSVGQLIHITNALRGLDGDYLIHQLTSVILGGETWEYTVKFGEYNPDLIDMLIAIKSGAKQYYTKRLDEVLNELIQQSETLGLVESTDRHEDDFSGGLVNRWIALPPTQAAGHNVEHEALSLVEATEKAFQEKSTYLWDETGEYPYTYPIHYAGRGTKWDFFSWG